VDLRKLVM